MLFALLLLTAPPPPPELAARAAELSARARSHHEAREYVHAANAYVALSSLPGVDVDDALGRAHLDLEAAFSSTQDAAHLCRALQLARGRLALDSMPEQKRLFWEETVAEDLEQLAELGGETICPPVPPKRVSVLIGDNPPVAAAPRASSKATTTPLLDDAPRPVERRLRARRAAGWTLTGVGIGFAGLMSGALAGYLKGYRQIEAAGDKPEGFIYPADQQAVLQGVRAETQVLERLTIGLGVASAATLAVGIGLVASHRGAARRMALLPSGVPRGGGLALRVRF